MLKPSSIICKGALAILLLTGISAFSQSYQVTSLSGAAYTPLDYTFPTVHSVDICYDEAISDPITENIFIGFHFNYAGSDYASVTVSSNGFLAFVYDGQNLDGRFPIVTLPPVPEMNTFQNEPIIAPFWDDLRGDAQSKALYLNGPAYFIFEWQNWICNNTRISFQVILYNGSNKIEFKYKDGPSLIGSAKIGLLLPNSGFFGPTNPNTINGQSFQFTPDIIPGSKTQGLTFSIFPTKTSDKFPYEYANCLAGYPNLSNNPSGQFIQNPIGDTTQSNCQEYNWLGYGFNNAYSGNPQFCNFNGYDYPSQIALPFGQRSFSGHLIFENTARCGPDFGYLFPNDLFYSFFSFAYAKDLRGATYKVQMRSGVIETGSDFGKAPVTREIFKRYEFNAIAIDEQSNKWFCGLASLIKYNDRHWATFTGFIGGIVSIEKDGTKWIGNNYNFVEYSSSIIYKSLGDEDFDLGHKATSGLPVTYTSSNTNVATIVDGKVHIIGIGATTIKTNQSGNAEYKPLPTFTQTLIVKETNTIAFDSINVKTYGDADFLPIATSTSGLPVSYKCYDTTVATVVNGKIHITGSGTCNIYANQKGDDIYGPAKTTSRVLKVNKPNQTIAFYDLPSKTYKDYDFDPGARASSGLSVSYSSDNENVATIVNGQIHITGAGTCKIYANQKGDDIYRPAETVSRVLRVNKANQTITFHSLLKRYGDVDFDPGATASSGLPVTYSQPEAIPDNTYTFATLVDGKIHLLSIGTVKLNAYQEGNANYLPAEPKSTYITINKFVPDFDSFSFEPYPNIQYQPLITIPLNCNIPASSVLYQDPSIRYIVQFTRSDGNVLEYSVPYSDTIITFPGAVGVYKVLVEIVFTNPNCQSSTFNLSTFNISKANQAITFDAIKAKTYGDTDFALGATSNTNLAVNYSSSNLNVATVENGIVHIVGAGTCSIHANQSGNENYHPASTVSQMLTVNTKPIEVNANVNQKIYGEADPSLTYQVTPDLVSGDNLTGALARVSGDNVGTYAVQQGTLSAGNNYSITFQEAEFTITKKNLNAKADNKSRNYGEINPALSLSFNGFAYNDDKTVIDNLPTISCAATQNSISGTYPIELVGGADNNYNLTLENGTLQVNPILGTVITTSTQNITSSAVDVYGNLTSQGGDENIVRGFVYGTSANPTILNSKIEVGTGLGTFNQTINSLTPNTKYYVRSYATNSAGTVYGNELFFTTLSTGIPTHEVSEVTIYPNPTTGILHFKNIDPKAKVEIYNLNGTLVQRVELVNNQVNIKELNAGTYVIKILSDDKINSIKVVKE